MTIRVLIVDDHAVLRAGFRTILAAQPDIEVVGEATTGSEALTVALDVCPDVITMDVQMPDMDGVEATRQLVSDPRVTASIVIVTTFDHDDYLFAALDAGASGFLLKNAGPEELVSAVRLLADGSGLLSPEVTLRVLTRFAERAGTPVAAAAETATRRHAPATTGVAATSRASTAHDLAPGFVPVEPLTGREREVLRLVAEAWTNAEIARELYIGEATVKTHVSRILQKLGARDRAQAIVLAHRHGLH